VYIFKNDIYGAIPRRNRYSCLHVICACGRIGYLCLNYFVDKRLDKMASEIKRHLKYAPEIDCSLIDIGQFEETPTLAKTLATIIFVRFEKMQPTLVL